MGSLEVCVFLFVCACVWAIDTLLHGNMHFIPLCEAPRPESKLRPFAVKSNTPLCAVQGFLLSLSLLLNVMLFCMCIFNGVSNTQGTPLHLALPQIYIFHIYTGPKFTQNLFFKFCIKLYQVNSSELDIFGYFLFAKKSPKNDIKCTFWIWRPKNEK